MRVDNPDTASHIARGEVRLETPRLVTREHRGIDARVSNPQIQGRLRHPWHGRT